MSDRPRVWIGGQLVGGCTNLVIEQKINNRPTFTGTFKTSDIVIPARHATLTVESPADYFKHQVGSTPPFAAHVSIQTYGKHPGGKRALWGLRRGYIQVGSAQDKRPIVSVEIPNVRLST